MTQAYHDSSAGKATLVKAANCDGNRAGLFDTAKRPESEEPVETAQPPDATDPGML